MRIPFRQGLVRAPANFLQLAAGKVSLALSLADSVAITFADNAANYLLTERLAVPNAWVGPFAAGSDYWLYIDINTVTGARTFSHTTYAPTDGPTAPAVPLIDQHWFDTTVNTMKVWNGNSWLRKVRVFVTKLQQGSVFVSMSINSPSFVGTQVGSLAGLQTSVGALVFDGSGAPLKKADGTFFTTEDTALTGIASSSQVKFGSIIIEAFAASNLPAFSIVRFSDFNVVNAALNYLVDNGAYGIIETGVVTGEVVSVVMEGLITNPAWDWTSAGINAPIYVDNIGQMTTVAPPSPIPVAAVVDKHTILLRPSSLFLNTFNDPATVNSPGNVKVSVPPVDATMPIVVGDNDPRITAVLPHITDFTVHTTAAQNTFLDSLTSSTAGLSVRKNDNTGVGVSLVSPASGLVISNPDGTTGNPTFALADDLASLEGMTTTGTAVRTGPSTWATRQLVIANDSTTSLTVTNGDGVAGNPFLSVVGNLKRLQDMTTGGIIARNVSGVLTTVALTSTDTPGLTITNGDGVAGNPTLTFSSDLAALTHQATYGLAARTADGVWTTRTLTSANGGLTVTNGDGVAGNPTIEISGEIASIGSVANTGIAVRRGANDWDATFIAGAVGDIVITNPRGFVAGSPATTVPVTLSLQDIGTPVTASFNKITTDTKGRVTATSAVMNTDIVTSLGYTPADIAGSLPMSADINMANFKVVNVGTPVNSTDVANKGYVDSVASGLDPKQSVRAATTTAITISGLQTVDGISLADGDRVLVKNQADATTNGIYVVNNAGLWARATDVIPGTTLNAGAFTFVESGTVNSKTGWVMAAQNPIINGTTLLTWQQFSGTGEINTGNGLVITGNTMAVVPSAGNTLTITPSNIDLTVMPTVVSGSTYTSVTVDSYGRIQAGTIPTTLAGYSITDAQAKNDNLTNISALASLGMVVRSSANTFTTRTLVGTANQVTVALGDGTTGNPTLGLASDPVIPGTASITVPNGTAAQEIGTSDGGLRYNTTTAMMRMHEAGSWKNIGTLRSLSFTAPALGFTVTQIPDTLNGTSAISFALNGELAGLQGMGSFGIASRTNTGTWTTRTVQGTAGNITVVNGNGIAGDPTLDLASNIVSVGTYRSVTVDTHGRVTGGTNPTTLAGYGITDAQALNTNLTQLGAFNTNGFMAQTATGAFAGRVWSVGAGASTTNLVITNGDGSAGNPTIAFQGDMLAITQLNATGFAVRTGAQKWAQRQLTGAANRISITNGDGAMIDPMIDISASYAGQPSITTIGTINAGTWNGTTVAPQYGGTGLSSLGGGNTLFGINAAGSAGEYKTVNGTANQITVTHGVGTITLATPQNIGTTANVQFNQVTTNQAVNAVQALTDAATVTVNLNAGTHMTLLATSNVAATRALANPSNMVAGTEIVLKYQQDSVGGRELTFGSAYKFAGGTKPVFAGQAANVVNIITFWCDGTTAYESSRSLAII